MGALRLKSVEFRRERQASWRELEKLVDRVEKRGVRSLGAAELSRLPILYREAISSLGVARAISLDRNVVDYLEALAGRAFLCVYGTKTRPWDAVRDFFAWRFPAAVRRARWALLLAAGFLFLGTLTAFALTLDDPDRFYAFIPEEMAQGRTPTTPREVLRDGLYGEERAADRLAAFSSMLFTHNSRVGLLAFGLGFLAGVPSFILLFWNGLTLGALAAVFHRSGLSPDLWGWLLPHGVTELTAVAFCGGAGLLLAQGLVFPGLHGRRASLALKGREAGLIVVGAVCMLAVAGLIEGVFRQTVLHIAVRYAVALATLLFWAFYFARAGRGRR